MLTPKRLSLNLASYPSRNKRYFYFLLSSVAFFLLIVSFSGGNIFSDYRWKTKEAKASILNVEKNTRVAQREEEAFKEKIGEATKKYEGRVDLVNGIILRKSFSWVSFLSSLENALPNSSYIISLAPKLLSDSSMEVKFKVVSRNLNTLLRLINNLKALKFYEIRVESEAKNEQGLLISEISLNYERDI